MFTDSIRTVLIILFLQVILTAVPDETGAFEAPLDSLILLPEGIPALSGDSTAAGADSTAGIDEWTIRRLNRVLREETGGAEDADPGWKEKKNSRVAMLCALVFPGLGQMYNEKPVKAAIALGLETYYLSQILMNYRREVRERRVRDQYPKYIQEGEDGESYLSSTWLFHDSWVNEYKERKIDWVWWSAGLIVALIFDAYVDSHLHDMSFKLENIDKDGTTGVSLSIDF